MARDLPGKPQVFEYLPDVSIEARCKLADLLALCCNFMPGFHGLISQRWKLVEFDLVQLLQMIHAIRNPLAPQMKLLFRGEPTWLSWGTL